MASIRTLPGKDGKTRYYVQIRLKGHKPETAVFYRLTDAKKWIQETESDIRNNRYFKTAESRKHTFNQLADLYLEDVLPKKKSGESQRAQLIWWKEQIGEKLLSDISPVLIAELKDGLLKGITCRGKIRTPATVNRYLAILSHVFSFACKERGWITDNPLRAISKPKESRGRVRFLDENERERLLTSCKESKNSVLYLVVILALSTGMRYSEIMNLTWSNVDFFKKRIILEETKNGEKRQVPLEGKALELLKAHEKKRSLHTLLLFPGKIRGRRIEIRAAWEAAVRRAGIENFRFHDLRHCCASYLAMNGASMAEIAGVLGHKTLQMTKRYTHLSDNHLSGIVSRMNEKILG